MTKLPLACLVVAGLVATHSRAEAGWIGWNWQTSHFANPFTKNQTASNIVRVPSNPSKQTLLVFLPGTGEDNESFTEFLDAAANHGYYAIALDYRHGEHVPNLVGCWPTGAAQLYEQQVRGVDNQFFPWDNDLSFPSINSVNYRLGAILQVLQNEQPAGTNVDWMQFWNATAEKPAWSKIVIAGHSQGGSTAGWILKNEGAKAGLIFEGMFDRLSIAATEINTTYSPLPVFPADCFGAFGDNTPSWTTPGAWVQRMLLVSDKFSTVYSGSPGKHIAATAVAIGKTHERHLTGAPSAIDYSWYTIDDAGCGAHGAPIVNQANCQTPIAWRADFWGALLERVPSLATNVPWQ